GIRDDLVTGVQTCALPILGPGLTPSGDDYLAGFAAAWALVSEALGLDSGHVRRVLEALRAGADPGASGLGRAWISHATRGEVARSEERRVGKEWRCGWGAV